MGIALYSHEANQVASRAIEVAKNNGNLISGSTFLPCSTQSTLLAVSQR